MIKASTATLLAIVLLVTGCAYVSRDTIIGADGSLREDKDIFMIGMNTMLDTCPRSRDCITTNTQPATMITQFKETSQVQSNSAVNIVTKVVSAIVGVASLFL